MPPRVRLHIDESGSPRWPPPWGTNPDKHYVVVGLILDGGQIAEATEGVPALLERYFPDPATRPKELHYGDIINKRKVWSKLSGTERKAVSDEVFRLILEISPILMGTVVVKEHLKTRYGDSAISPALYGLRATFGRFDRHLADDHARGDVVLDSAGIDSDLNVRELVNNLRQDGTRLGPRRQPGWLNSHLGCIDDVRCVDSREDHGVQLADFVAYVTRAKFERAQSDRYSQLERLWRSHGGRKEPFVVPSWG
jgi:hypothetical protein